MELLFLFLTIVIIILLQIGLIAIATFLLIQFGYLPNPFKKDDDL